MKCIKCGASVFDKPLYRTEPIGSENAGWMCFDCIKKYHPELANNLSNDGDKKVVDDVFNACNK